MAEPPKRLGARENFPPSHIDGPDHRVHVGLRVRVLVVDRGSTRRRFCRSVYGA